MVFELFLLTRHGSLNEFLFSRSLVGQAQTTVFMYSVSVQRTVVSTT